MTDIAKSRVMVFLCMIGLCLLIGCGAEEEAPVYDTTANPHGFPKAACDMLDAVEAGRLATYDVITEAFGRLYLENQELLENSHWHEVIEQLGGKFHRKADAFAEKGVPSYSRAAGFYILAAFANPNDAELSEKAQLFTAWKKTVMKIDYNYVPLPTSDELTDRLDFLRSFVLGDSLQRRFAEEHLAHQLLDSMAASQATKDHSSLSLTRADEALLANLGITDSTSLGPLTKRDVPPVYLLAQRLVAIGPHRVRAELYFTAIEEIDEDFRVALAVDSVSGSALDQPGANPVYRHFDPIHPTSSWSLGQVQVAATILAFDDTAAWMRFTFSRASKDDTGSVVNNVVGPSIVVKQPTPVERLSER